MRSFPLFSSVEVRVFLETSDNLGEHEADMNQANLDEDRVEILEENNAREMLKGEAGAEGNIIFSYDWISDEVREVQRKVFLCHPEEPYYQGKGCLLP